MDDDLVNPPYDPAPEHALWSLSKAGHRCDATAQMTETGLELRIAIDGELSWSRVYRVALAEDVAADAEEKRLEFEANGWTLLER